MSITSVEINLANGGSHTATVSEDLNSVACGTASSAIKSNVGGKITSGNSQIDGLLSNFLIESVTNTKDPRGSKAEFKLIDKYSEILNRYIILVRGITASPFASETYDGFVYGASEMPSVYFEGNGYSRSHNNPVGKHGVLTSGNKNGIFILGSTYSIVSGKAWKVGSNGKYEKTERYSKVFQKDQVIPSLSFGNTTIPPKKPKDPTANVPPLTEIEQSIFTAADASVRYGYTAKEFFAAVKSAGVPVSAGSITSHTDSLFEQSGTMADVLSEIAAFYGYYWYIDILGSSKGITLIKSSDAHAKTISAPSDSDTSILSYSSTSSNASAFTVLSFSGDTEIVKDDAVGGGGSFDFSGDRERTFKLVPMEKIYGSYFEEFFTFFSSAQSDSDDSFDKFFFLAHHAGVIKNYIPSSTYTNSISTETKYCKDIGISEESFKMIIGDDFEYEVSKAYSSNSDKTPAEFPSKQKIYTALKGYFQHFGKLYISSGISASFARRNYFTGGDGVSISGPFDGGLSIDEIPDLAPLANMLKSTGTPVPTMGSLANFAGVSRLGSGESGGFYFLGLKANHGLLADNESDVFDLLSKPKFHDVGSGISWLIATEESANWASSRVAESKKKLATSIKKLATEIRVFLRKFEESDTSVEDTEEPEDLSFDKKFFSIKTLGAPSVMSKASLLTYSGNTIEVQSLAAASEASLGISSGGVSSSSVTYAGLKIPTSQNILIDSISVSLGSEGFTTTINQSTKLYLPIDQSLIINQKTVNKQKIPRFSAGAKNFFKLS